MRFPARAAFGNENDLTALRRKEIPRLNLGSGESRFLFALMAQLEKFQVMKAMSLSS